MIDAQPDGGVPRVRASLFWTVVEPLFSLMDIRSRVAAQTGNARVRLPHSGSRTSWAVRGVDRSPIADDRKNDADESCW